MPHSDELTYAVPDAEPLGSRLMRIGFGAYAWLAFLIIVLVTLVLLLLVPGVERRRQIAGVAARLSLRVMFMPLVIRGLEHLPAGQCVVAANHASYIDAVVIKAVLPERFAYVVKREAASTPFAGLLLKRLGTEFVERFNRHRGALDARRVMRSASSGQSLLFFPEGTFITRPGLLKFHSGAFRSAVSARCPVVPCVIRGTRAVLASPRFFPRPGRIEVELLEPVALPGELDTEQAVRAMRDLTRARILERVGEPDLAPGAHG